MSERSFFETINYQRELFSQKWQLAKIDMKCSFNHASEYVQVKRDGHYPISLKEVFDKNIGMLGSMLRNNTEELVGSYPDIPAQYIRGLMNTPSDFQGLGGKTPYQAILDEPTTEKFQAATIVIRRDVYDLDNLISDNRFLSINRSFFAKELRR